MIQNMFKPEMFVNAKINIDLERDWQFRKQRYDTG